MPIYSNLYSNLARQGFTKTFTHGYAQSVVAATHPQVYAAQNRPGFGLHRRSGKAGSSYHFQNAFHSSAQSSSATLREVHPEKVDGGLDAYFDAWRKHQAAGEPEQEWTQFQFTKRIEWKPSSAVVDPESHSNVEVEETSSDDRRTLERSYSASALDDIKAGFDAEEEAALAQVDAAIEREIKARNEQADQEIELSVGAARTQIGRAHV